MEVDAGWRTQEAAEMVGATYRKLHWWLSNGVLGEQIAPGAGQKIVLVDRQVEALWVVARLSELGAELPVLCSVGATLMNLGVLADDRVLVVFVSGAVLVRRRSDVMPPDPCWFVPVMSIGAMLDSGWVTVRDGRVEETSVKPIDGLGTSV